MATANKTNTEERLSGAAKLARMELEKAARPGETLTMLISPDDGQHELKLPSEVVDMLMEILENLAMHKAVSVVASDKQMTTQEVADILRVSRPFVTKLIDEGKLEHQMVGTHRRVRYNDLLKYKEDLDKKRREKLDELVEQAQELGMGY